MSSGILGRALLERWVILVAEMDHSAGNPPGDCPTPKARGARLKPQASWCATMTTAWEVTTLVLRLWLFGLPRLTAPSNDC